MNLGQYQKIRKMKKVGLSLVYEIGMILMINFYRCVVRKAQGIKVDFKRYLKDFKSDHT
jgi:hypothetical protein